jgi:hypothetical protein
LQRDYVMVSVDRCCIQEVDEHLLILLQFFNPTQFYTLLLIVDLFALIFYAVLLEPAVIILMIASASILIIRVMIKEQTTIKFHRKTDGYVDKTMRLTMTRDINRKPAHIEFSAEGQNRRARRGGGTGINGRMYMGSRQVRRRGAGLTDIERVTVMEHGRSVNRPLPSWQDEESGFEALENELRTRHREDLFIGAGGRHGDQALIAAWTRGVEIAMSSEGEAGEEDNRYAESVEKMEQEVEGDVGQKSTSSLEEESKLEMKEQDSSRTRLHLPLPALLSQAQRPSIRRDPMSSAGETRLSKTIF